MEPQQEQTQQVNNQGPGQQAQNVQSSDSSSSAESRLISMGIILLVTSLIITFVYLFSASGLVDRLSSLVDL